MHAYFKSITLENIRCFGKKQTIDFTDKNGNPSMWNLILGDNGTGKTTVLRALAISTIGDSLVMDSWWKTFSMHYFLRENTDKFIINLIIKEINSTNEHSQSITYDKLFGQTKFDENRNINKITWRDRVLFGYGAARHISTNGIPEYSNIRAQTLFDDKSTLLNAEEWLVQAEYLSLKEKKQSNLFDRVKKLLLSLFEGQITDIKIETAINSSKKINVLFQTHYGWVPLHELSLGYKTLLAWMVDFAHGLFEKYPDSPNPLAEPAICLVDEIDLHLHPRFQQKMIRFLSELFPKTQFIVTAHSPLIAKSAVESESNLILLRREDNEIEVVNDPQVVKRWRVDQLLASDLFEVFDEKMERRRDLLRKPERSSDEEAELKSIEKELNIIPPHVENDDLDKEILDYLQKHIPVSS